MLLFGYSGAEDGRGAMASLLREQKATTSSMSTLDETLSVASGSLASMQRKRGLLEGIRTKMGTLHGMFPQVNQVIGKIRRHKQRDAIILAFVIALCLFFTVVYSLRKRG